MGDSRYQGEFEIIHELARRCTTNDKGVAIGMGDDAAQLHARDGKFLISTDLLIEGVHFKREWSTPRQYLRKAWVANLSDINAMGGHPRWLLLGLGLPRDSSSAYREEVVEAAGECCREFGVELVGGDTVASPVVTVSVTVIGDCGPRILSRAAAEPGQHLLLSGSLGRSRAGLDLLERGQSMVHPEWVERHLSGQYPHGMGEWLASHTSTTACIDISDGLFSEAHHLARESKVRLVIDEAALPIDQELRNWLKINGHHPTNYVGASGEEFQLLFTSDVVSSGPEAIFPQLPSEWEAIRIGTVEPGEGLFLQRLDGSRIALKPTGWDHFL